MKIRIGTRTSKLALAQTQQIASLLEKRGAKVEIIPIHTQGDVDYTSLSQLGGSGVFVSAIRLALLTGKCDLAVHSYKDLPTTTVAGITTAAVPKRAIPDDVIVSRGNWNLDSLPVGAKVGTGSPRRAALLLSIRPDLSVVDIRGNIDTRLGKVHGLGIDGDGRLDAVILAQAGLIRINSPWANAPKIMGLPAPAQGALALETRTDNTELLDFLLSVNHWQTRASAMAERAVLAGLQAGCAAPVAAYAKVYEQHLQLQAQVLSIDGKQSIKLQEKVPWPILTDKNPVEILSLVDSLANTLGSRMAKRLLAAGAGEITDLSAQKTPSVFATSAHFRSPACVKTDLPLLGRTVFLARSPEDHMVSALQKAGANVLAHPLTEIQPNNMDLLAQNLKSLANGEFSWFLATSSQVFPILTTAAGGAEKIHEIFKAAHRKGTKFAALGTRTAAELSKLVKPDLVTTGKAQAETFLNDFLAFTKQSPLLGDSTPHGITENHASNPRTIFLPTSAAARSMIPEVLTAAGWKVNSVAAYTVKPLCQIPIYITTAWKQGMIDAIVFTAGSIAKAAQQLLGCPNEKTKIIAFGSPSAEVAKAAGFMVHNTARTQDIPGVITAIKDSFSPIEN